MKRIAISTRKDDSVDELSPVVAAPTGSRPFGLAAGQFTVPAEFDDPLPEEMLQAFEGSASEVVPLNELSKPSQ